MMCDDCGIRPANIHLTTIVNGEKQEKNLCAECLQKNNPIKIDFQALAGHLSDFIAAQKATGGEKEPECPFLTCPKCGTTYEKFQKTGLVGCPACYDAFREPLAALLTRLQGHAQHTGRIPGGASAELSVKRDIDRYRQELAKAISAEEYETAATLRDRIRALTAQLEEPKHE